jgi:hypothetical protein
MKPLHHHLPLLATVLLAGVWGDVRHKHSGALAAWLALVAILGVGWWYFTELSGAGDLRPYLLLQGLPILLIPLWQWIYKAPAADRGAFVCLPAISAIPATMSSLPDAGKKHLEEVFR